MLTLPGDIPLVTADEIGQVVAAHRPAPSFTIVPSHDEGGSNAILLSPPDAVPLRFGVDSFFPHLRAAEAQGIRPTVLRLPGIALDIDNPEDLAAFAPPAVADRATRALLAENAMLARDAAGSPGSAARRILRNDHRRDFGTGSGRTAARRRRGAGAGRGRHAAISRPLMKAAAALRDHGHGDLVSYSPKVFIPLTQLCRDVCHYCTFAHPPRPRRAGLSRRRGGAGDRPRRGRGRLPRGAVHAGRQARTALCRRARGAGPARPRDDALLPRRDGGAGAARDRAVAASEPRRHDPRRSRRAAPGLGLARDHARKRVASGCAGAAARISARPTRSRRVRLDTIRAAGEARGAVHLGHPDRHRRDPARADRVAAGVARSATTATATSRKSSSRISAPSPARGWRTRPSPISPTICGRSRSPG